MTVYEFLLWSGAYFFASFPIGFGTAVIIYCARLALKREKV